MRRSGELNHKRDPAGHIPRLDFTLQRMLSLKLGAAVVDHRVQPFENLSAREANFANGELE